MTSPGPNPSRQDAPHPHQALIDPTDSYIVVPDLGADLVRVFNINHSSSLLTAQTPFNAPPGSGPRHGAFSVSERDTFFFLVSELGNTAASYNVTYGEKELDFDAVFVSGIYGNRTVPEGAAAAGALLAVSLQLFPCTERWVIGS
jgi:6-phosphogluconolactonase (cycloisomerase 2 family)